MRRALRAVRKALYVPTRRELPAIALGLFIGTGGVILFNDHVAEISFITGASMSPTLSPKQKETGEVDSVLWRKYNPGKELKRGDIVLFMNPLRPDADTVKRVVALEGDVVKLDKRRRPQAHGRESNPAASAWDAWHGKVRIPQGHVWVEGDNWRESLDSNDYGPISRSLITGRAVAVVGLGNERFGTKPWEGWKGRTEVRVGKGGVTTDWTETEGGLGMADGRVRRSVD